MKPLKVRSLSDLKVVKRTLAEHTAQRIKQTSAQAKAVQQAASDKDLFVRAAGAVSPMPDKRRVHHAKVASVPVTLQAYRLLAARTDAPLHVGVTEAGTVWSGTIKSAVGIGALKIRSGCAF